MTTTTASPPDALFLQVLDLSNRPNPYPMYERMLRLPPTQLDDGTWLISRHDDIHKVLHDPRVSANRLNPDRPAVPSILQLDAPDHDRLRRLVMRQFAPRVVNMRAHLDDLVTALLDAHASDEPGQLDVVADLAYPLPVTVICELLGVPRTDEPIFGEFARVLTRGLDPVVDLSEAEQAEIARVRIEMIGYMNGLIEQKKTDPGADLLSALLLPEDPADAMAPVELVINLVLLLIAGHETTVNLIANGTLTLLRNPMALSRLRDDPSVATTLVEEVLRYDPPVQMTMRSTRAEMDVGGVLLPAWSRLRLMLAAGSRDDTVFDDPGSFVPDRAHNPHLGFGGGMHYCVGAMLARAEAQIALTALSARLVNPRLVADPPPYRDNAVLRGPAALPVAFDRLR